MLIDGILERGSGEAEGRCFKKRGKLFGDKERWPLL